MPHDRMLATRHTHTWIQKYIFPGGLIPSVTAIEDNAAGTRACGWPSGTTSAPTTPRRCGSGGSGCRPGRRGGALGFDEVFGAMWLLSLLRRGGLPLRLPGRVPVPAGEDARRRPRATTRRTRAATRGRRPGAGRRASSRSLAPVARARLSRRSGSGPGTAARQGPAVRPALVLRTPQALRRMIWHPGELGIAQAYVTGELDVDGDLADGLRRAWARPRSDTAGPADRGRRWPGPGRAWRPARRRPRRPRGACIGIGGPLPPPAAQARVSGRGTASAATTPSSPTTTTCPSRSTS